MTSNWFQNCLSALALCAALAPAPALAQATDSAREQAIEIGQGAIDLYESGQYRVALERFRTADRALHSPVFALYAARCLEKLGRLTEAQHAYERLAREQLPSDAPAAWRAAHSDAEIELRALTPRVPSARVTITGAAPAALALDGAPLDITRVNTELFLDPGVHEITARDQRGRTARARFELGEGERDHPVQVLFPAQAVAPVPPSPALALPPSSPPESAANPATDTLAIVLLSTAGAGLVAGTVTGILAALELQDVRERCDGVVCRASDERKGRAVENLALASTLSFGVGGACLGAWGVRVILAPPAQTGSGLSSGPSLRVSGAF